MMPEEQLLTVLRRVFTDRAFDIPFILGQADYCPELVAAMKAAIPNCCRKVTRKQPLARELFRNRALRPFFTEWAKQHCTTDAMGWWYLKDPLPHGPLASELPRQPTDPLNGAPRF
jgi:hypothetical protein